MDSFKGLTGSRVSDSIITVLVIFMLYSVYMSSTVEGPLESVAKVRVEATSADKVWHEDFVIKPALVPAVMMKLKPNTRPGVVAFKLNTSGQLDVYLVKWDGDTLATVSDTIHLDVQRMDVAKFVCDACGATHVVLKSTELLATVQGKITQLY